MEGAGRGARDDGNDTTGGGRLRLARLRLQGGPAAGAQGRRRRRGAGGWGLREATDWGAEAGGLGVWGLIVGWGAWLCGGLGTHDRVDDGRW